MPRFVFARKLGLMFVYSRELSVYFVEETLNKPKPPKPDTLNPTSETLSLKPEKTLNTPATQNPKL